METEKSIIFKGKTKHIETAKIKRRAKVKLCEIIMIADYE